MTDVFWEKACAVMQTAMRRGLIIEVEGCLSEHCYDPLTMQNTARRLGFFYHFGRSEFVSAKTFLKYHEEDLKRKAVHRMDKLWLAQVKQSVEIDSVINKSTIKYGAEGKI
jgi:hypothetical protein